MRTAVCCSVVRCVAVCDSVLQCVAVRCRMLQCVAVCCSGEVLMPSCIALLKVIELQYKNDGA